MTYRLLAVAEAELSDAAVWYESQAPGLGQEFLDEFERTIQRILQFPEDWAEISQRHRRCLFRRFPYAIVYSCSDDIIRVGAIAHLRQDPRRVEERINKI